MAIDADKDIKGEQVVAAMTRISATCGLPKTIRIDNVLSRESAASFGQQISMRRQPSGRHAF